MTDSALEWLPPAPPRTQVAGGFDGSDSDDWTALRLETRDGYLFTPRYGPDRRPTVWLPEEWGGWIPRSEVHAAVDEVFATYRVGLLYADPPGWTSEVDDWQARHGDDHVQRWETYRGAQMHAELERFRVDVVQRRVSHDGCPYTATAMLNARKAAKPGQRYGIAKPSQTQKIDPAVATVLAHAAAQTLHATGWPDTAKAPQISTAAYGFN